ncbi:hypothetical protein IQ251_15140 [Saccharopolyspora sp. HNM0983]|uniref:Uncharacterized protein n=1 Tax=Saccharopolyspora montiporae TaxID=2781240 RepID=A0A929FYH2_9PSEU|nr:hypothetical protein [Saccharopolyspora sp. HNM0983]MBE9375786.1 hypothetical protein [Saccharopolyspora sp. HNM0983]
MTDPFLESVATALAGQAAAALGSAGKQALSKIRDLVRSRAGEDPETSAALAAAEREDAGQPEVTALAERLDRARGQDSEFAEQLRDAGEIVHNQISATGGGVVNHVSGNANKVIQADRIEGGITFN